MTFLNIIVDPCGVGSCMSTYHASQPFPNMMFPASGASGTRIGYVFVAMSDGSNFNGTVASSDGRFAVTGCPSLCKLVTNTTGLAPDTHYPLTLTASQTGIPTSAPYSFTPISTGTTPTIEGVWYTTGNTLPGNTYGAAPALQLTIASIVVQAYPAWNGQGGFSGAPYFLPAANLSCCGGPDGAKFAVAHPANGAQVQYVASTTVLAPNTTYHFTVTPTQAGSVNSGVPIPLTFTTGPGPPTYDTPLTNSQFPSFVKFAGTNPYGHRGGNCRGQAVIADVPFTQDSKPHPFTEIIFRRQEDFAGYGVPQFSFGTQVNRDYGIWVYFMGFSSDGAGMYEVMGQYGNASYVSTNPPFGARNPNGSDIAGQWIMSVNRVVDQATNLPWEEGVDGKSNGGMMLWPVAGQTMGTTLGSYQMDSPMPPPGGHVVTDGEHHPFNGSYSNGAIIKGIATPAELEIMRNNPGAAPFAAGSPEAIWGSRVWGHWLFRSVNPQVSPYVEPDVSGNGHDLTYYYGSDTSTPTLPILYTPTTAPGGVAPSTAVTYPTCG